MLRFAGDRGFAKRINWLLRYRPFGYILFVLAILLKLKILHSQLHALYIDMNLLDDLIAIGSAMLVSFWTLWLPPRGRSLALAALNVLLTALIFSDLVYYRYFRDFITVPVLLQAGQVGELGGSIRSLIYPYDLWLIADWGAWLALKLGMTALKKGFERGGGLGQGEPMFHQADRRADGGAGFLPEAARRQEGRRRLLVRFSAGVIAFALGFVLTLGPIRHYAKTWAGSLFENNWWNVSLYNVTGLLGFHFYDASKYVKERLAGTSAVSAQERAEIQRWFDEAQSRRAVRNETFGGFAGSNVLVIQAEAFMNFVIGKQIGGQEITPNINRLMEDSLYYPNYYHQTGQGRTSDADFSSHSSLHPLPVGSVAMRYPNHMYDVLPRILKERGGYTAEAFHAYEGSFWNRNNMYQAMGYERFFSKKDFTMDEPLGWSLGDKSFFRQSLALMTQEKQPFYDFMITLSSHHPYTLPADKKELDTGEFEGTMFGDYLQSVHYVDAALGELVEGLKQAGLWDNTILYFYGDHDNSLTDKADYERFLGKSLTDLDMHQIMNQVPLLIHLPDGQFTGIDKRPAGQLDMAPSLLHLLGISPAPYYMMGNNLFAGAETDRFVVLRSGAFTDGRLYYIPSADNRFENGQCYDLETRDAAEIGRCRAPYEQAQTRLRISDAIITGNLIADFRKEN